MKGDRRNSKRSEFKSSIRYQQKGSQKFGNTIAKDISTSGIGFISNEFIPKNSKLIFELKSSQHQDYTKLVGEVVWISNQPHSERFYVGAKFTKPSLTV